MSLERIERHILAPAKDWLTASEVADWLAVSETRLRQMVRAGEFPAPQRTAPSLWHWRLVDAWSQLRAYGWPPLSPERRKKPSEPASEEGR